MRKLHEGQNEKFYHGHSQSKVRLVNKSCPLSSFARPESNPEFCLQR